MNLRGKIAVVTGGAGGIGAAVVREFLHEGAKHVAIWDVHEEHGLMLEKESRNKYGDDKAKFTKCDVAVDSQIFEAFDRTLKDYGYIDLVVNNAGVADERLNVYRRSIKTNLIGVVTSTLKALELMRQDRGGRGGTIINVSSVAALQLLSPSLFIYEATKSAILHLTCCMGMENYFSTTKVRTITVCFGKTITNISVGSFDEDIIDHIVEMYADRPTQTIEATAKGLVEAYTNGQSGSVWIVNNSISVDITEKVKRAFNIMFEDVLNTDNAT